MFQIVKKCKISLSAQDQLSGEHYRTVGPLVLKTSKYAYEIYTEHIKSCQKKKKKKKKNQTRVPLRAIKTFIRKKMGHTT